MYGDCQVALATSMGGENGMTSTTTTTTTTGGPDCGIDIFSSPIRNPNISFNFMTPSFPTYHPFPSHMPCLKEEREGKDEMMMESMTGSELNIEGQGGMSGNEIDSQCIDPNNQQPSSKKKRYHRHTARQIQEMETFFRVCPHPDDKQRSKLSEDLGLKPRQVKFWFQNRRTQMKAQQDRTDNAILRSENDNIKNENYRLEAVLKSLVCPSCGGTNILGEVVRDEQQLRMENVRLKEELDKVCAIASRYSGRSPSLLPHPPPSLDLDMNIYSRHFQETMPPSCSTEMVPMPIHPSTTQYTGGGIGLITDEERPLAMEIAGSSTDELIRLCQANEPIWVRDPNTSLEVLNVEEYSRIFVGHFKQHSNEWRSEGTRNKGVVIMNSINLVDAFLDVNKWIELFPSIVVRARTIQVLCSGVAGRASGSLHLMCAELQVLSPLVPTRETYFLRYCHQNVEEGTWVIVDFPVDNFDGSLHLSHHIARYRRHPSGCLIQDMLNGYSRVTWIEHADIAEEKPTPQIFEQYVHSGMAFGAKRWLSVLQRQCERAASLMPLNISDLGAVMQSPEARKNLMRLAERMVRTLCVNISTSGGQSWTALSESVEDTVRITTRKVTEPGQPSGLLLCAVSTTWLPYSHDQVFDLLKNERHRSRLEALSNGTSLHEVAHIANGSHPGNCISLLRVNVASNPSGNVELMLQESSTDASGSLVVYTTIEVDYIQLVMSGEDTTCIPLLPMGFSIIPLGPTTTTTTTSDTTMPPPPTTNGGGCLLTVALQVHASTIPNAKLNLSSVTAINNHICTVVHQINDALDNSSTIANPNIIHNNNNNSSYTAVSVGGSGLFPESSSNVHLIPSTSTSNINNNDN